MEETRNGERTTRQHDLPAPFLGQQVQRQIAQPVRHVEKQDQQRVLLALEPEVLVHAVCLRVAEVAAVDGVEEVHDGQEGEEVVVEFADFT